MSQLRSRQENILPAQQWPITRPVVQYIRQSSKIQVKRNRVSGDMQDADMHDFLVAGGYKPELILPAISIDTGKSGRGRRDEREGLDELYRLIETESVGAAAAFSVSRIYRTLSLAETGRFCDLLQEKGIPFITKRRTYWPTRDDMKALQVDFQAKADEITDHILGVMVAARNYNVEENKAYGGNAVPVGFQIVETVLVDEDGEELIVKRYAEYKPHADLVRWLFRRYRELGGNLPRLSRELEDIDFKFPPLEPGIFAPIHLERNKAGYYPLRNRETLIYMLKNTAYIGTYKYRDSEHKNAHAAIVAMDDFMFAWERLGVPPEERKPTERHYGGTRALLDGVLKSGETPVYVLYEQYVAQSNKDGWKSQDIAVDVITIDTAFADKFQLVLSKLNNSDNAEQRQQLHQRIEQARIQQEVKAKDFSVTLARIDTEIANARMAQRNCQNLGDNFGHQEATKQLVQLYRDRAAVETKAQHATKEASELKECHDLVDRARRDWCSMKVEEKKRLIKLMMPVADIQAPSTHFIRLRCYFGTPYNCIMDMLIYRKNGSRHIWRDDEKATLRAVFSTSSKEEIMQALPDCSWAGINQMAEQLHLSRNNPYTRGDRLTYNDMQVMAETGAKVDDIVWYMAPESDGDIP